MPLRITLSPDLTQLELSLPSGGKTLLRIEGHTGCVIAKALLAQRRAELAALINLGLEPESLPEAPVHICRPDPKLRAKSGRTPRTTSNFTLEDLGL